LLYPFGHADRTGSIYVGPHTLIHARMDNGFIQQARRDDSYGR